MYMNGESSKRAIENIFKKKVVEDCIQEVMVDQCIHGNASLLQVLTFWSLWFTGKIGESLFLKSSGTSDYS